VVHEPVDERGGDHRVTEDLAPLLEGAVGGDDDRAALVAAGDEREQQVRGLALERQVADLVDDEQVIALKAAQLGLELVSVLRCLKARDPLLGRGEGDTEAVLAGFDRERDRQVRLARSRRVGVELLTLWMFCRSGCDLPTRRGPCPVSSCRCWVGARRTARRR